jgi:hypothetical protein
LRLVIACSLGLLPGFPRLCVAQQADITPFQLTGVEGAVSARYILDDFEQTSEDGDRTYQMRPTFEEEIAVLTHSYVYHPGFLNMDLGGGLLFLQQDFDSNQGKNDNNESLYNLTAYLNFLEQKPYPFTLYYDRSNPSVTTNLSGRFLVRNERYGVNAALHETVSPVALNMEAFRFESDGSGFGNTIDQTTDQAAIRAFKSYGRDNNFQLSYIWTEADSRSGSVGLPTQQTVTTTKTTDASAFNRFGAERQLRLTQLFTYTDQTLDQQINPSSDLDDLRYSADLRWLHSEHTRSFYQYRLLKSDRSDVDTDNQNGRIGIGYEPPTGLHGNIDVHAEKEDQDPTGFDRTLYGTQGLIGYEQAIPKGSISLGASMLFDRSDQSGDEVDVRDEQHVLNGTTLVPLQNSFVETNSIEVFNTPRTQRFTVNVDYEIVVVGATTSIRRIPTGAIFDGQTVLVDYTFSAGGDIKFDTFNQNYYANLKAFRFHDFFARYRNLNQKVTSGEPTTPLNDIENILLGARAEYPLRGGWLVGGEVNYEDQEEDISPFTRELYKAWLETSLPRASRLRVTGRREFVENEDSPEDVDITQVITRLTSRPWLRTILHADFDYEKDTGGTRNRRRRAINIGLVWRYRRLQFSVRGEHINDRQGIVEQENSLVRAELVRIF